jgi:hypothetical protein
VFRVGRLPLPTGWGQAGECIVEQLDLAGRGQALRFESGLQQQPVDQAHQLLTDAARVEVGGDLAVSDG